MTYARERPSAGHDPATTRARRSVGTVDEAAVDACLGGAGAHDRGVGPPADQQLDRLDQHRLAGAGLTGERGEPGPSTQVGALDHAQVLDVQLVRASAVAQRSVRPNLALSTWW